MSHFGNTSNPHFGLSTRQKYVTPKALLLLLAVLIAIAIIWFGTRTGTMKKAADLEHSVRHPSTLLTAEKKPKPPAGKLLQSHTAETPLPPLPDWPKIEAAHAASTPPPLSAPSPATTLIVPAPIPGTVPLPPTPSARPAYAPLSYNARHDKAFGGGCSGNLVLSSSGIQFTCPADSSSSMQISISEIKGVDENGVRLASGKKLHFSITGMTKPNEQAIFTDWFSRIH